MLRKYFTLGVLFLLPITVYLFFAVGIYHFKPLPIMVPQVTDISEVIQNSAIKFEGKVSVLGFLGDNIKLKETNAFNLNQKVYKRFHEFNDFQFVIIMPYGIEEKAQELLHKLGDATATDMSKWQFVFGEASQIKKLFNGLQVPDKLDNHLATDQVYIIDNRQNLRGRNKEKRYGYNSLSVAEISNIMVDDIKVLLAEYRLETKTNVRTYKHLHKDN